LNLPTALGNGPSRGIFNGLTKMGLASADLMVKSKITPQQALKTLEKYFKEDLTGIYSEIDKFREGKKSLEVYTE